MQPSLCHLWCMANGVRGVGADGCKGYVGEQALKEDLSESSWDMAGGRSRCTPCT